MYSTKLSSFAFYSPRQTLAAMAYSNTGKEIPDRPRWRRKNNNMSKFKRSAAGRRIAGFASVGMALIAITPNVFATAIPIESTGQLIKNNSTALLSVSSNTPCIAFSGIAPACSGTATPFVVSGGDPIFKTGTTGTIKDINSTPITAFETVQLTSGGPAIFDLLNIITPTGFSGCTVTTTSGSCSTGTFIFTEVGNQVSITLALNELGYVGSSSTGSTSYEGIFSTTLSGNIAGCTGANCSDTIGNILLWESGAGNTISSSWSATQSPVPEPMTSSLMGIGLVGLGLIARRRKQS